MMLQDAIAALGDRDKRIAELEAENVRLKAELAEATEVSGRYTKIALHQQERLLAFEAEVAALREDRERLDWMESGLGNINETSHDGGEEAWYVRQEHEGQTLREAIDAARKEQQ